MKLKSKLRNSIFIAVSSSMVIISTASAQTWDGGGTNNNWSNDLNWNTDVAPVSGATLIFAGTTQRSNNNNLASDTVIGGFSFTNATGGAASQFTLSGNRITLGGNITTTAVTSGGIITDSIGLAMILTGNRTITTNTNHSVALTGIISDTGGAFGLIKNGASALTLSGNNTYTGVTAINVGAIRLTSNNGFGSTVGNTTIAATGSDSTGGRLALIGSVNTPENITITGTTEAGGFNSAIDGSAGTVSGNITLASPGAAGIRLGAFTAAGNIVQTGTSRNLILAGTTVNNAINNNGGTLVIVNSTATLKGVSGTGIGLTDIGQNGTAKLGVTNALNTANDLSIGGFGAATDTNTFDLASYNQTVRGLTGSTGNRFIINSVASSESTLTLGNGTTTSNSYTFSGTIRDNNGTGGTVALVKTGTGTQTLSGANTYSGGTTHSQGILVAGNNTAFGTGDITFTGSANGLVINNGISIANNITVGTHSGLVGAGLIRVAANGTATLSGTITINNNPPAGGHFGTLAASSGTLNITGEINSTVAVSQRNATVILSGGGSYTQFNTNQGTTRLGANNGLSTTTTLNLGASGAANFDLAGFNQTLVGITRVANTTLIGNSSTANSSTLTTTGTSDFSGIIQNTLGTGNKTTALTVNGGSLTLSGANTYTGATSVTAGTLRVNGSTASGSAFTVSSGATLAGAGTVSGTVAASGSIAPGNGTDAIGQLNTGTTTWQDTGIFQFNLSNSDDASDKLNITGDFTRGTATGNTYAFNFMGSTPIENGVYTLASWSGSTTFTAANFTFTPGSLGGTYNSGTFSITGANLQFTAIPEASNLLIGGLLSLGLLRRRRNGASN